jgi:hypothetical protein
VLIGLRLRRILADRVDRPDLSVLHSLKHLRQISAVFGLERRTPGLLELGPNRGIGGPILKAHQTIGDGAHVAATLHVVLAPKRVDPGAVLPDMPGEQCQIDETQDIVHCVVVLGDAERPTDLRAIGAGIRVGCFPDDLCRHPGFPLGQL